jgi:hypothetical protein
VLERLAQPDRGSLEPFEVPLDEQETSLDAKREKATAAPIAAPEDEIDDPPSGAHTFVEPVVTPAPTASEEVVARPARWPWVVVALVLIAGAGVLSYVLVRSLGTKPVPVAVAGAPDAAVVEAPLDASEGAPIVVTPLEDAMPVVVEDAAAIVAVDAAPAVALPSEPDRPRIAYGTLTIDVTNAKSPTIRIDGVAHKGPHASRRLVIGREYTVVVSAQGRKTKTVRGKLTNKATTRSIALEDDLMKPEPE